MTNLPSPAAAEQLGVLEALVLAQPVHREDARGHVPVEQCGEVDAVEVERDVLLDKLLQRGEQVAAALWRELRQQPHDAPDGAVVGCAQRGEVCEGQPERLVGDGVEHLARRWQAAWFIEAQVPRFGVVRGVAGQAAVTGLGHIRIVDV